MNWHCTLSRPTVTRLIVWAVVAGVFALPAALAGTIVTGPEQSAPPSVRVFPEGSSFLAYDPGFVGGVRVASGDVDADGSMDIVTGTGAGAAHVKVFSGTNGSLARSFLAYGGFSGGVYVAAGDVNGDGSADIVTGAGTGAGPHVKVFDGQLNTEVRSFFAYVGASTGGVRVAAGDVSGDGLADIITGPGPGAGPHVKVFDGSSGAEIRSFFAYGPSFLGGIFVASGDVNGDAIDDIVTGTDQGVPSHVKAFDGQTGAELRSFFAYDVAFTGGVRVAAGDLDGDGLAEIITGAGAGGPHVKVFDGSSGAQVQSFFAYDPTFTSGVYVASIPEPRPVALFAAGLLAFAVVRIGLRRLLHC